MHAPSWHTMPVPQLVPFGWLSVSVQTAMPVAHSIEPDRQGLPVTGHAVPWAQAWQSPSRQTEPAPQAVPLPCRRPVSTQDATPAALHTVPPA